MTLNFFKRVASVVVIGMMTVALSGCLYPKDQLTQNKLPPKDAILTVQAVVDQYQKDTGLLPILNSTPETPLYEKYRIDFEKLQQMNYVSDIPATAYEKGGSYYYLIINEETDPTVKLMNLVLSQKVNDIQASVKAYSDAHQGKLPTGKSVYPDFTSINYDNLNLKEPVLQSVFTGQTLSTIMDAKGNVYLDYGIDITQALNKLDSGKKPDDKQDLRELLVEHSDLVPVKSPIYRLKNGEPQAMLK
ncbi:hypothetical protein Back11_23500 [Paenibacillus baekrokdamisoli]|uniref:Uncharacterized protein n=1 Tax=Paenibacillus baekrokdamisoli TaxID=1712516 RepID=A0A3G9IXX7_9BACL|nr:hypothetical protein [Paenibacillus baekrokdamisoli]MBB3069641.1 hypothetical protein [Paenibacillus baekrokdamisoli]BBH21005.1 hypothetical protein Back11_23500 [Paenibacillus baekrokdamisoli]